MASRLFSASKSARRETRKEEPAERPSALPRRPSSSVGAAPPPTSTKTSRIPAPQSSSLPRSKAKSAERSTATAQAAAAAKSASHEPEPASRSALNKGLDKNIASGVPTGIPVGMGIRTEISSNNPPLAAPTRHRLRRKASTQNARGKYASSERSDNSNTLPLASTASSPQPAADPYPDAILGISMPEMTASAAAAAAGPARSATTPTEFATSSSRMATFALQQPHKISTIDTTPPTSNFGVPRSSASSSRYSGSPGPFSRTSTPTSASSHSPGLLQAPKFVPRPRPSASPTTSRPPVTRRKLGSSTPKKEEKVESRGLPVVRESQTPSSSSSTVQDGDPNEHSESSQGARKTDKRRLAPTPPLRLSSKKGEAPESSRIARPSKSPSSQQSQPQAKVAAAKSDAPSPNSPPPRPSREGITSLDGLSTSPVIQSNLSRLATTGHKRRESIDHVISSPPSQVEESMASRSMSRRTSSVPSAPSVKSSIPQATTTTSSQGHARGREGSASRSESQTGAVAAAASESSDAVVRSPSKSPSRFGLFTRRIKSPSETSIRSPPTKLTKKGPAAGTGHEGYGRYARRGRSTSTTSTAASRNRSTSSGSTSFSVARQPSSRKSSFGSNDGKPELDDFYKERLEPVVIGGGGMIRENRNSQQSGLYQTSSGQSSVGSFASGVSSIPYGRPRDFSVGAGSETASQRESRELLPAPRILSKAERTVQGGKTLAHRRSLHRSQLLGEDESVRIPPPINTRAITAPSPAMETYDSTVSSAMQSETSLGMSDDVSEGHEGNWLKPKTKAAKAPAKSKPGRRWNFFQRLQRSPERSPVEMREQFAENSMADEVPVAISAAPLQGRPAAYYTMLDEEDEHEPEQDLESILRNVEGNLHLDEDEEEDEDEEGVEVPIAMSAREQSMLLPSPPQFPTERFQEFVPPSPPRVPLYQSHSAPTQAIAQAQAVARAQAQAQIQALEYAEAEVRNRQQAEPEPEPESSSVRKPSRLQQVGRIPRVVSKRDRLHNPSPRSFSRPFVQQPPALGLETDTLPFDEWNPSNKPASAPPVSGAVLYDPRQKEFMAFPPRNYSQASGSSSSGTLNLASVTAITPSADAFLGEDEVWNEYDDLLEHVEPTSAEMRSMLSEFPSLGNIRSRHPPTFFPSVQRNQESWQNEEEVLGSSSSRPLLPPKPDHLTVPVQEVLVASPTSLSELYSGYGNRSSAAKSNPRHSSASMTSGSRYSSQTIISESGSRSSVSSSYVANKRVTQMMAEKTYRASSDSLRFSALMTSRWLSFDRVLFSPAQDEVCNTRGSRVLVLDGLENDDWATYCALTYPDATIYNLAPHKENRMSADGSNAEGWTTPPNMRRISHANIGAPFPFPKGFFSAVVFRFPGVNTAAAYRNAIFECKRVLRPGGYLEMCVLDMDLLNMGDRARRVVRGAKVRLQDACPEVCLSPISDTVMKLLGRRGFENINRCMVGVPVAGAVSKSRAGSMDDVESNSSQERASARKTLAELFAHDYQGQQSIDVMKGQFTGARMVARVGRWWWTHCYEKKMLLSEGDEFNVSESVWNDRALLDECEERETSLRLVVCYAQKPESVRRRTVSV